MASISFGHVYKRQGLTHCICPLRTTPSGAYHVCPPVVRAQNGLSIQTVAFGAVHLVHTKASCLLCVTRRPPFVDACSAYSDSMSVVVREPVCVVTATLGDDGWRRGEGEPDGDAAEPRCPAGVLQRALACSFGDGSGPAEALRMFGRPGRHAELTRPGWRRDYPQARDGIEDGR